MDNTSSVNLYVKMNLVANIFFLVERRDCINSGP